MLLGFLEISWRVVGKRRQVFFSILLLGEDYRLFRFSDIECSSHFGFGVRQIIRTWTEIALLRRLGLILALDFEATAQERLYFRFILPRA